MIAGGLTAIVVLAAVVYTFRDKVMSVFQAPPPQSAVAADEPVSVLGKNLVAIQADCPLKQRLSLEPVEYRHLEYPLLNVTGYVMARLAPGKDRAESRWDFGSPEVATAYGDWLHACAEVLVLDKQADKTRQLADVQVKYLKSELDRKIEGYSMGAVPERDLVTAKAEHLKAEIQTQKDITEAESALRKAERNRALLERQLFQAGVDPEVVRKAHEGLVLVVADVPEAKVALVKVGQPCDARFFGVPDKVYQGKVGRLGPSVSREKRTLRVTFELMNPSGKLLPGMFADIGLGAEARDVLTVPTEAVLHAGQSDYVLKEESPGKYRAVMVKVDEPRQITQRNQSVSCVPVLDSDELHSGDRVVSAGAILLKPIMVKALAVGAPSH